MRSSEPFMAVGATPLKRITLCRRRSAQETCTERAARSEGIGAMSLLRPCRGRPCPEAAFRARCMVASLTAEIGEVAAAGRMFDGANTIGSSKTLVPNALTSMRALLATNTASSMLTQPNDHLGAHDTVVTRNRVDLRTSE